MEILNDYEKSKIIKFNQDEILIEAVRKVLLATIYTNGTLREGKKADPLKNGALGLAFQSLAGNKITNEELGEDLRGLAQGVNLLEAGFVELAKIKEKVEEKDKENEAI